MHKYIKIYLNDFSMNVYEITDVCDYFTNVSENEKLLYVYKVEKDSYKEIIALYNLDCIRYVQYSY